MTWSVGAFYGVSHPNPDALAKTLTDHRRDHHRVTHAMKDFFIRRANRGQCPAKCCLSLADKVVGAQAHTPLHHGGEAGLIVVGLLAEHRVPENLQNMRMLWKLSQGHIQGLLPFHPRKIRTKCDTTGTPSPTVKSADLNDQVALFLAKVG